MSVLKNKDEKESWFSKLTKKARLVVVDLDTFEEVRHFNFTTLGIIIYSLFALMILVSLIWLTIAYTSIREAIPGYPNIAEQKRLAHLDKKNLAWIEEKQRILNQEHIYYKDLMTILRDSIVYDSILNGKTIDSSALEKIDFSISKEDSILRQKIEEQEKYLISQNKNIQYKDLKGILFFPPVYGELSDSIDVQKGHFGIDIIAPKDEAVKSTLGGTVIVTDWSPNNGNVIYIQHNHNLVSVYKHNSVLLKKVGDIVKTGEPIAIIGNSGNLSTGPHLHFELWHKGTPLNPTDYINFNQQ